MSKPSPLNVLYVSPNGFLGGAERFVLNSALSHKNEEIKDFYFFFNDGLCRETIERLTSKPTALLPIKLKLSNLLSLLRAALYLRNYIKEHKIHVINATMPYAYIVSWLACLFLPVKKVWFQHGPVGGTLDKLANLLSVDLILLNSEYLKAEHNKMFGAKRNLPKQSLIRYGNQEQERNPEAEKEIIETYKKENEDLILSIGRICSWKGQLNVLKALKIFKESSPQKVLKVLMVGSPNNDSDQRYYQELLDYAEKYKLNSNVVFISHVTNPQDYMRAADYMIHSSTIPEPFGLVVSEAMLNHCLVIGSNIGGVTDILRSGETGYHFDSTGEQAALELSKVLKQVQEEKKLQPKLINQAYQLIKENYSLYQMAETLEASYLELFEE